MWTVLVPSQVDASFLSPAECGSSVSDQCQVSIWEQLQVLHKGTAQYYFMWNSKRYMITMKLFKNIISKTVQNVNNTTMCIV